MKDNKSLPKPHPSRLLKNRLNFLKQLVNPQPGDPNSDKLPNDTEQFTSKIYLQKTQTPKKDYNQKIGYVDPM